MSTHKVPLIIAASTTNSDLYYTTRFLVPDPVVYFEIDGKKHLILSDLEIDRARLEAQVHVIHSSTEIKKKIQCGGTAPRQTRETSIQYVQMIDYLLRKKKVFRLIVPSNFPSLYFQALKKLGYTINIKPDPFFEKRLLKTEEEKIHIRYSIIQVEKTLYEALEILQKSKIKRNKIYYGKELVTSEFLRTFINTQLMKRQCVTSQTIVSSGPQASLPHHIGAGPIIPHTPIIFDIYPQNTKTRYCADMTRTFVKGKPSTEAKQMFKAVLEANKRATEMVKDGVNAQSVHFAASQCLLNYGFKTGKIDGQMQGFIHSTGHGLGLDVHEPPSISKESNTILKKGHVITIEPGLYYKKYGGVRIEDDHYVTKNGSEKLTKFPYYFEIDTK